MELKDILKTAQAQKLLELEQQTEELRLATETALLPEVRAAVEAAISHLGSAALTLAQTPSLQEGYSIYGTEGLEGLSQLERLESILPEEQLVPLRQSLTERVQTANEFFNKYGTHSPEAKEFISKSGGATAVGQSVEVVPIEITETVDELESEHTSETPKTELTLLFREDYLQIGKQGRVIPFQTRDPRIGERDYSQYRKSALKALIANQGRELRTNELKDAMGEPDIKKDELARVRDWLLKITYRRQPLVVTRGIKRGMYYSIAPNFALEIEDLTKTKRFEGVKFTAGDMYIAARHLEQFNPFFEEYDMPIIDCELSKSLEAHAPDFSRHKGNDQAIWSSRQAAFGRATKMLDSDDDFFGFLDRTNTASAEFKFAQYLFDLEVEQRQVLSRFMHAKVETEPLPDGGIRLWAVDALDKNNIIASVKINKHGELERNEAVEDELTQPASAEQAATEEPAPTPPAMPTQTYDYGEIEAPLRSRLSKENRMRLDLIRVATEDIASRFLVAFNPEQSYKRQQLETQFRTLTTRAVATALENNVGPSSRRGQVNRKLNIHDVVNILIYTDPELVNIYCHTKLRKQVKFVISKTIEQTINQHTNQQSRA